MLYRDTEKVTLRDAESGKSLEDSRNQDAQHRDFRTKEENDKATKQDFIPINVGFSRASRK